jgi:hypothetical protein
VLLIPLLIPRSGIGDVNLKSKMVEAPFQKIALVRKVPITKGNVIGARVAVKLG